MNETLEQIFLRIVSHVSPYEKERNKSLIRKTHQVLKSMEYLKAISKPKKNS